MSKPHNTCPPGNVKIPKEAPCAAPFTQEACLIDLENKRVFMNGVKYGEILEIRTVEKPTGIETVLKISIVSDNKYLNGQTNFISLFEPK